MLLAHPDPAYVDRLHQAIDVDPNNSLAKRAFVDAVAKRGLSDRVPAAQGYLRDLRRAGEISRTLASQAAAHLMRAAE